MTYRPPKPTPVLDLRMIAMALVATNDLKLK